MKKMYFLFSLWPLFALGQVTTGFENGLGGEWDQFPENRWESSHEQALSCQFSLYHSFDNITSGNDRISLKVGEFDFSKKICWEFTLRHGYKSSSTNKWQIFLASDKSAGEAGGSDDISGYILGVNITGSDDSLRLYAIQEGQLFKLCTSSLNYENDIGTGIFHCIIKRDSTARWEIYSANEDSALQLIALFQEPYREMTNLKHFMLSYSYTSSKDRLLWFDDLSIQATILVDTIPPRIEAFSVTGRNSIILIFSEDIDSGKFRNDQILLIPGNIYPEKVIITGNTITCYFTEEFVQRAKYQLIAAGLNDLEENVSDQDSIEFLFYQAEKNDLVFTEIMADPEPVVYLADREYIELFNRCGFTIDLDSFTIQAGKKEWIFPDFVINPGEYIELTSGNGSGDNTLPLFNSLSVIANDGQKIYLRSKWGEIIAASEFYPDWYDDEFKSQGGWSLERIDENYLCGGQENWKASEDISGGTPGRPNSVQAIIGDNTAPTIERLEFINENKIRVVYSEHIDPLTIPKKEIFALYPDGIPADSVIFREYFCSDTELYFKEKFIKGTNYELSFPDGIRDCEGNRLKLNGEIRFGLPSATGLTDLIISEILFSAFPGYPEYIEFYNLSDHLLDLSDIRILVSRGDESGVPSIPINIPVLIFPGEYFVLCKDKELLLSCYDIADTRVIIEVMDLPSFPDDGACIRLFNKSLEPVDIFCYKPEDEFPMLTDHQGVSLERLTLERKTGDQSRWHSASSVVNFGTPGAINSQSLSGVTSPNTFEVLPEIFSPDNDGLNDMLEIHYSLDKEGFVSTLAVFDPSGRVECFLGQNEILGTSGMFLWDGRDDKGNICKAGLYLIYAEIWNLKGEKERFKKSVVLVKH